MVLIIIIELFVINAEISFIVNDCTMIMNCLGILMAMFIYEDDISIDKTTVIILFDNIHNSL